MMIHSLTATQAIPVKGISIGELNEFFKTLPILDKEDLKDFSNTLKEIRSIKVCIQWLLV